MIQSIRKILLRKSLSLNAVQYSVGIDKIRDNDRHVFLEYQSIST